MYTLQKHAKRDMFSILDYCHAGAANLRPLGPCAPDNVMVFGAVKSSRTTLNRGPNNFVTRTIRVLAVPARIQPGKTAVVYSAGPCQNLANGYRG